MDKRFLIAVAVLGTLAMLAVWIFAAILFVIPQYKIARDAGLGSVASTIAFLTWIVSAVIGYGCNRFCVKAINTINKHY